MNPALMPIPHDIPLPMPGSVALFKFLIVFSFLAHILFVNLMVGGSVITVVLEYLGWTNKAYDKLAREVAKTITVNKSMAVVLGVAPLLLINVLYTMQFYSANALTGAMWIMIVPLVAGTFLVAYLHKYSWDWEIMQRNKPLHLALGCAYTAALLFIPLIFLSNINLMLLPERWTVVHGWLSSLWYGNVFPRYFHFILASLAVTSLFLSFYLTRKSYDLEAVVGDAFTKAEIRRYGYIGAFLATGLQFAAGPLVLVTMPWKGLSFKLFFILALGVACACVVLYELFHEIIASDEEIGSRFWPIVGMLTLTVAFMGISRHTVRETALAPHQKAIQEKTAEYQKAVKEAAAQAAEAEAKEASDSAE